MRSTFISNGKGAFFILILKKNDQNNQFRYSENDYDPIQTTH